MLPCHAARVALLFCIYGGGRASADHACDGKLGRADVVRCALAASLDVQLARLELKALAGRRLAANLWLPNNPVLSATLEGDLTHQSGAPASPVVEWQVTLAQEIEIAGQRRARLDTVDAEAAAQVRRVAVAEQETVALALRWYFELTAAERARVLADELSSTMLALATYADERAREALMAPIDAHLIRAEAVRVGLFRADVQRRVATANAHLEALLGRAADSISPTPEDLPMPAPTAPDPAQLVERALLLRGEVAASEMETRVVEHQLAVFRRSRIPNLTLSAFTGVNVLGEQFLGGGVSLPVPLPAPVGRTRRGEIAETMAHAEQAQVSLEQVRRRVRLEVQEALANERARAQGLSLYGDALLQQARTDLQALRDGIATHQLSPRDALVAERTLIELLIGYVDARLAYALAWVDVHRAAGDLIAEVRR